MRELTSFEMQNVSGAGFFDFIGAVVVGAVTGISSFGLKWGMSGGSTGGVLGVGIVSAGVGLIVGAVLGLVDGALYQAEFLCMGKDQNGRGVQIIAGGKGR